VRDRRFAAKGLGPVFQEDDLVWHLENRQLLSKGILDNFTLENGGADVRDQAQFTLYAFEANFGLMNIQLREYIEQFRWVNVVAVQIQHAIVAADEGNALIGGSDGHVQNAGRIVAPGNGWCRLRVIAGRVKRAVYVDSANSRIRIEVMQVN